MKKIFYLFVLVFITLQTKQALAQYPDFSISTEFYADQLSSGINNYGYSESVYSQFTGYDIFDDPNLPTSMFQNLQWFRLYTLDVEAVPSWAWGFEFQRFTATSEESYSGEGSAVGPDVNMTLYLNSFNMRAFFGDLVQDSIQGYINIGWGIVSGDFASTTATPPLESSTTSFRGPLASRTIGVQIAMEAGFGIMLEYRNLSANRTKTSNDPFNQAPGEDLYLDFGGAMINFTLYSQF